MNYKFIYKCNSCGGLIHVKEILDYPSTCIMCGSNSISIVVDGTESIKDRDEKIIKAWRQF